jgi:hypothetical protein
VGVFLILQLVFHYPLARWWPELDDVEFGRKLTRLQSCLDMHTSDQPLILALGSSLTGMGLRPAELNGAGLPIVFNFAIKGSSILSQRDCLRRLLADGIRPDRVLVEAYPPHFLVGSPEVPREREEDSLHRLCLPWHYHRTTLMSRLLPRFVPADRRLNVRAWQTDEWGWETSPAFLQTVGKHRDQPEFLAEVARRGEAWSRLEFDAHRVAALQALTKLCRQESISIVLIWPPEASFIRAHYSLAMNERCDRWLERVRAETAVPIINARDWMNDSDFIDGLHLTPDGAITYTRKLQQAQG